MKRGISRVLLLLLVATVGIGLSLTAYGAGSLHRTVHLTMGEASTIDLGRPVADILVADPAIADVGTLRSNRVYIVGKTVGNTNVLAFDDEGNPLANVTVQVRVDEANLQQTMQEFFPSEKVNVRTVKNDIILTGTVSNPSVANQVRDLASRFVTTEGQSVVDLMRVSGEQQVMLKVKVIEAKRAVLREYGFETDYKANNLGLSGANFNSVGGQNGLAALAPFATGSLFFDNNHAFGPLKIALAALEKDGLINTLAEPNLTAISGETAGFLAGGEFPVPTGRDNNGNIIIEFKKFGVSLNFTPTVLGRERISLQLSTEVSSKSTDDGVTLVNTQIPGLTVRRAETTIEMGSGGSLMIAGLLKSNDIHSFNGLPGAKDLPIIGELFKSQSFTRDESELIILVTPYLVEPYAEAQAELVTDEGLPVLPPATSVEEGSKASSLTAPPVSGKKVPTQVMTGMKAEDPLSRQFVANLRKVYGDKLPQKVTAGRRFGYIVD